MPRRALPTSVLSLVALFLLLASLPSASAAPLVTLDEPDAVTVEPNSTFTVDVTAHNEGSNSVDLEIKVKNGLLDGFTLEEGSGVKFMDPIDTRTFTMKFRVGEVEPGNYTITLYDLAPGDQESPVELEVNVEAVETPTPTETATPTETPTETGTVTEQATETPTETSEATPTGGEGGAGPVPGFGAAAGLAALACSRRFL